MSALCSLWIRNGSQRPYSVEIMLALALPDEAEMSLPASDFDCSRPLQAPFTTLCCFVDDYVDTGPACFSSSSLSFRCTSANSA